MGFDSSIRDIARSMQRIWDSRCRPFHKIFGGVHKSLARMLGWSEHILCYFLERPLRSSAHPERSHAVAAVLSRLRPVLFPTFQSHLRRNGIRQLARVLPQDLEWEVDSGFGTRMIECRKRCSFH